jgi:hypothetical protein
LFHGSIDLRLPQPFAAEKAALRCFRRPLHLASCQGLNVAPVRGSAEDGGQGWWGTLTTTLGVGRREALGCVRKRTPIITNADRGAVSSALLGTVGAVGCVASLEAGRSSTGGAAMSLVMPPSAPGDGGLSAKGLSESSNCGCGAPPTGCATSPSEAAVPVPSVGSAGWLTSFSPSHGLRGRSATITRAERADRRLAEQVDMMKELLALVLLCVIPSCIGGGRIQHGEATGFLRGADPSVKIFYWLFEASSGAPRDAPLVVWLQGGPGASSLFGAFAENGPYRIHPDTLALVPNNHTWAHHANLLYIDNPAGLTCHSVAGRSRPSLLTLGQALVPYFKSLWLCSPS